MHLVIIIIPGGNNEPMDTALMVEMAPGVRPGRSGGGSAGNGVNLPL
jgi:hypothetical protein